MKFVILGCVLIFQVGCASEVDKCVDQIVKAYGADRSGTELEKLKANARLDCLSKSRS